MDVVLSNGLANSIEAVMECWVNNPPKAKIPNVIINVIGVVEPGAGGGTC